MTDFNRRSVIAIGGVAAVTALAGCNGGGDPSENGTDPDGNSSDGGDEPSEPPEPSVEIVSPEDGGTVDANSTTTIEISVEGFNLVDSSVAPDSVEEPSGYAVHYLRRASETSVEEEVFSEGEPVETEDTFVDEMDGENGTVGNRLIGPADEYYIIVQLVSADGTATQYYNSVTVTATE